MPKKSPAVDIELSVLKWHIHSAGGSNKEIARRLNTHTENLLQIIDGKKKSPIKHLRK